MEIKSAKIEGIVSGCIVNWITEKGHGVSIHNTISRHLGNTWSYLTNRAWAHDLDPANVFPQHLDNEFMNRLWIIFLAPDSIGGKHACPALQT